MLAKRLHTRCVAQIQTKNFQAVPPLLEIRLGGVAHGGIARETGGDDKLRPGAQQFDAGLVTDLHAAAGEQRHAPTQVGGFSALEKIQFRTRRTKLIVEMMDLRVIFFADVTILRFDRFVEIGIVGDFLRLADLRRKIIRRGKNGFAAQFADAGLMQLFVVRVFFLGLALLNFRFHQLPALGQIWAIKIAGDFHQARVVGIGQAGEQGAIGTGFFQQFNRSVKLFGRRRMFLVGGHLFGRAG